MPAMKFFAQEFKDRYRKARANYLRKFGREEDGGLIILNLVLFIIILVIGGMAVDFMRFESRRTMLQSVSDRAVLAAANLNQNRDAKDVVNEYFEKAGFDGSIVGEPAIFSKGGTRSVGLDAQLDVNTFYLRLIGIDQLSAPAASSAIQGSGNVEISLVLDISGSMRHYVSGTGKRRIELIREAASGFVTDLLKPEYRDQISISLITYSAQVALNRELFNALNVTTTDIVDDTIPWSSPMLDPDSDEYVPELSKVTGDNGEELVTFTNPATCIDIPASEYNNADFDTTLTYAQVETFQHRTYRSGHPDEDRGNPAMDQPNCPSFWFEQMIPVSQDLTDLTDAIAELQPRQFTSIYLGMKWGVTMLDPSMRDTLATMSSMDPVFAGDRPSDYTGTSDDVSTQKYIIIMTDGENVSGRRIDKVEGYDTVEDQVMWATSNWPYARDNLGARSLGGISNSNWSKSTGNARLQEICKAAREEGITIFSIAMGAPSGGETQMRNCATAQQGTSQKNGFYFENDGGEIDVIFENIAKQITDLRLSL